MFGFTIRRLVNMIPTVFFISLLSYFVIDLAPGNFLTQFELDPTVDKEMLQQQAKEFGLDKPWWQRYFVWAGNVVTQGDFGFSFGFKQPVLKIFLERLPNTLLITLPVFILSWLIAIPIGVFSATHQYSVGDNIFTFLAFLSLSIPNFFFGLILMFLLVDWFNVSSVGGLFSQQYIGASWLVEGGFNWAKFFDYLQHLWPPLIVISTATAAGLMRFMRGTMLDIMNAQYVKTARAKGLVERKVIYKHAFRNAINPIISIFGQSLPTIVTAGLITSIIFNLPTVERLFFNALLTLDEYLAMTILLFFAMLLVVGNFVADIALAIVDPRIRYE